MATATAERLSELRRRITKEIRVNGPYSRNIIGIALREIDRNFGVAEANRAVREFRLETMGFNCE